VLAASIIACQTSHFHWTRGAACTILDLALWRKHEADDALLAGWFKRAQDLYKYVTISMDDCTRESNAILRRLGDAAIFWDDWCQLYAACALGHLLTTLHVIHDPTPNGVGQWQPVPGDTTHLSSIVNVDYLDWTTCTDLGPNTCALYPWIRGVAHFGLMQWTAAFESFVQAANIVPGNTALQRSLLTSAI